MAEEDGGVGTFHTLDYVVLSLCLAISAGIGVYHAFAGGRQRTAEEFLLADRNMHPFPVAVSLLASFISAVTMLGAPAETYVHGIMYFLFGLAYCCVGLWTARVFIPTFYEYKITSVNEVGITLLLFSHIKKNIISDGVRGDGTFAPPPDHIEKWGGEVMCLSPYSFD